MACLMVVAAGVLLAALGFVLGLLQRRPAARRIVPLRSWPVQSVGTSDTCCRECGSPVSDWYDGCALTGGECPDGGCPS